jgi:hypothetical protein
MSNKFHNGVLGESQDASHGEWTSLNGSNAPGIARSVAEGGGDPGAKGASLPEASPGGSSPPPVNLGTIVLVGMMLFALAGAAVLANNARKKAAPEAEEIVFEPEVVVLGEGSVVLNARYTTAEYEFFQADGEEEIPLSIVKKEGEKDLYTVTGEINGIQLVGIDGLDRGQICTVQIKQEVTYKVSGTFRAADACRFDLLVTVTPTASQIVAQGCSVDINLDFSRLYVAPFPEPVAFTVALSPIKSAAFTLYLHDVKLPGGVKCPLITNP